MPGITGNFLSLPKDNETLKETLIRALPEGFKCRVRYAHTAPKPCDPLFSPMPGSEPEKTRLASHFLTVGIPVSTTRNGSNDQAGESGAEDENVLVFAMEVLVYTTRRLTTMFVSKADSTGYLPQQKPSAIKVIATNFLWWLGTQQRLKAPERPLVISLFARAQSQYLFPGSDENPGKHVLDDRQLIKWWVRVLDPLFPKSEKRKLAPEADYKGYITVPGYHGMENIKHFSPSYNYSSGVGTHWEPGNPLMELAKQRGLPEHAPVRCLLPRFPDDPKARFMQDLDDEVGLMEGAGSLATSSPSKKKNGKWKSIHDLQRFWEAMEFRQECSSGRVVGFLWLVIRESFDSKKARAMKEAHHEGEEKGFNTETGGVNVFERFAERLERPVESNADITTSPRKSSRRKKLTGPIVPRQPRLKDGSSNLSTMSETNSIAAKITDDGVVLGREGYDQAMQTLLHLDFANTEIAAQSTTKWVKEVSNACGVQVNEWAFDITGSASLEEVARDGTSDGRLPVNDLGKMIRKKRKVEEGNEGGDKTADHAALDAPPVNTLGATLIRKKPKPRNV